MANTKIDAERTLHELRVQSDKIMLWTVGFLFLVSLGVGFWNGSLDAALLVGVPAVLVPVAISRAMPGSLTSRLVIAATFMIFSALLINQCHGLIETHFGIFALLAFLLYYRDWRVIVAAAAVIAVHHVGFFFLQAASYNVYVVPQANSFGIIVLHAVYVVVESAVLVYLSVKLRAEAIESSEVSAVAIAIGSGDLTKELPAQDEASPMLASVAVMQEHLRSLIVQIRGHADTVTSVAERLATLSANIESDAEQGKTSAATMSEVIGQMAGSITSLAQNAQEAVHASTESGQAADSGSSRVSVAVDQIKGIAATIEDASRNVELLGEKSDRVSQVVNLIRDVAGQTNLLALNAAIEAARAGEQGRGFAVVADEVRKLAERTNEATVEIGQMMDEMQASKDATLSSIESAVVQVREGVSHASDASRSIAEQVVPKVEQVASAVSQISGVLSEQSAATSLVLKDVADVAQAANATAASAQAVNESIHELNQLAETLRQSVLQFHVSE